MVNPLSVYLHIPFCAKKCAYCNFYSTAATNAIKEKYIKQLKIEIKKWGGRTDRPIDTVYFGGGTPSVLSISLVKEVLQTVFSCFNVQKDAEITFEVNPCSADEEYLSALKALGVNRLSIGLQSADDNALKLLGRTHNIAQAEKCFYDARKVGFDNISLDLMLALPNSKKEQTLKSLELIKALNPEHISAYMLILEENTALYKKQNQFEFMSDEAQAEEYLFVSEYLKNAGYKHYEISNFCKKGKQSRHNTKYWLCKEYIGIGASAYSYFNGKRFHYPNDLLGFISGQDIVLDEDGGSMEEFIMLNLRLAEGLKRKELEKLYKKTFSKEFYLYAKQLQKEKLCKITNSRFSLTDNGMLISNSIITQFLREEFYEDV